MDGETIIGRKIVQPPDRCEAPIGGTPLYKKQLGEFLQIFNILRKKEKSLSNR
jgi:hypothetical protein